MFDPFRASLRIASAGLEAQSTRLKIISENVANAQSTGSTAGADPYRRKTVTFANEFDRSAGLMTIKARDPQFDDRAFRIELDPGNPAADEKGYVKTPNVDLLYELADLREANRSYEANLQVAKQSGELLSMTISLLKDA